MMMMTLAKMLIGRDQASGDDRDVTLHALNMIEKPTALQIVPGTGPSTGSMT